MSDGDKAEEAMPWAEWEKEDPELVSQYEDPIDALTAHSQEIGEYDLETWPTYRLVATTNGPLCTVTAVDHGSGTITITADPSMPRDELELRSGNSVICAVNVDTTNYDSYQNDPIERVPVLRRDE